MHGDTGGRTRRVVTTFALAFLLLGCDAAAVLGSPVQLLTGDTPMTQERNGVRGCFTFAVVGELVVDPEHGTAVEVESQPAEQAPRPVPVMWRPGFTARQVGHAVAVLDPAGAVVATTGRRYFIAGGYWSHPTAGPVFVACDFVHEQ